MKTKEFTIREIVEAIKSDGFDHLRGHWIETYDGKLTGGCVLAQAGINLSILPVDKDELDELFDSYYDGGYTRKYTLYDQLNTLSNSDNNWLTAPKDTDEREYAVNEEAARHCNFSRCGEAIVNWNDMYYLTPDGKPHWVLKTYDEVATMAADILVPHLDKTVTLAIQDYSKWIPPKVKA